MQDIPGTIAKMRAYFETGKTKDVDFRLEHLRKFLASLKAHEEDFYEAMKADFNKPKFESYATEISLVYGEIENKLKHLKKWTKPKRKSVGLSSWPSYGKEIPEPYGLVLVMAPWNYPYMLTLAPVVGALAAGNCVLIKPSNRSPHTSDVIKTVCDEVFEEGYVDVVLGGRQENQALLEQKFDFIFFTGGVSVGTMVLEKAAVHLTPCILELGGKSPVFVEEDCDLKTTVRRLVWGKYTNAGQTCVCPDYILVNEKIHDEFLEAVKAQIKEFYYDGDTISDDFPHLITDSHYEKVTSLVDEDKVVFGGKKDASKRLLEPTIEDNVVLEDKIMSEEIFGPVMPILKVKDIEEAVSIAKKVNGGAKPLALYIFTNDKEKVKYVHNEISFGGGCVNDTLMHVATEDLPFGGVGNSGMGFYHGKRTFDAFTHYKGVVFKGKMDIPLRYPRYTEKKFNTIKKLL
ncbi:MAG: aldehyde dehydrogenase family protein [Bacillales bacterium]|nr:aldehyde dehydrogenase family protein [Bacillales bacterium]